MGEGDDVFEFGKHHGRSRGVFLKDPYLCVIPVRLEKPVMWKLNCIEFCVPERDRE